MTGEPTVPTASPLRVLWDDAASRAPHRIALRDPEGVWSYAELADQGRRCARWLVERRVRRGDRVLIRLPGCREVGALLYGTSRIGATLVPVSMEVPAFQLRRMLTDADPAVVLTTDEEATAVRELTERPTLGVHAAWREIDDADDELRVRSPLSCDAALLLFTSGTTATPKAVVCPHAQTLFATRAIAARLGYRSDDVVFSRLPVSFDYGLYQFLLSALATAELVLPGQQADAGLLTQLRSCSATVVPVVPPLATMLVALAARDTRPTRVRMFTNTGSPLHEPTITALRQRFPGARIVLMFGTTECKRVSILHPDGDLDRPGSVGRPLPSTEVLIVDAAGRSLPAGRIGEIVVRGPHVMSGYWRAPEMTARRFRRSPDTGEVLLHTGDYGWLDDDGYLYFQGRRDDIFKRRGVRVSTLEIETAALDISGVREAAAFLPGPEDEPVLCVVGDRQPGDVLRELSARLEAAKVPDTCHVLDALPLTSNGKPDKTTLQRQVTGSHRRKGWPK